MKKVIFVIILLMILLPLIQAKKSDNFITYASNFIYEECKNTDIQIRYPLIRDNKTSFSLLEWPYTLVDVYSIFNALVAEEPYSSYVDGKSGSITQSAGNLDGKDILICGNSNLDINGLDYFWNDLRIEVPTNINNIVLQNNGNLIQGLNVCNAEQTQIKTNLTNCTVNLTLSEKENFWFKFIYPAIMSLILSIVSYLIIFRTSRKKEYLEKALFILMAFLVVSYLFSFIISKFI